MTTNNYVQKTAYAEAIYNRYKNCTLLEIVRRSIKDNMPLEIIADAIWSRKYSKKESE